MADASADGPMMVRLASPRATRPISRVLKGRPDVLLIHIAPSLVDDVIQESYDLDPASVSLLPRLAVSDQAISQLGRLLLAEFEAEAPGVGLMADSLGRALVLNLLRRHSNLAPQAPEKHFSIGSGRLQRVVEHMHTHLDEDLTLGPARGTERIEPIAIHTRVPRGHGSAAPSLPHRSPGRAGP